MLPLLFYALANAIGRIPLAAELALLELAFLDLIKAIGANAILFFAFVVADFAGVFFRNVIIVIRFFGIDF